MAVDHYQRHTINAQALRGEDSEVKDYMYSHISPVITSMTTSLIRRFDNEVSQIGDVIKLTLGEPDMATPRRITEAGIRSLHAGRTHYAPNAGTPELRRAISDYLSRRRSLQYLPEQIIVTQGATEAISSVLTALLNPGDVLVWATPGFNQYRTMAILNGAQAIAIDTSEDDYRLTPQALESVLSTVQGRNIVVVLNYPANPTGIDLTAQELADLAAVIERYDATVVSDEVYAEIVYGQAHSSIAQLIPERTVLIDSASKTFAMTGWRLGFFAAPKHSVNALAKVHQAHVSTAATFVMDAAQEAYESGDSDIAVMVDEYRRRRDYLYQSVTALGYRVAHPQGAFYLYLSVPEDYEGSGGDYARAMAQEAHVAGIPGEAFQEGDSRQIRLSYAASMQQLHAAVERLEQWRHITPTSVNSLCPEQYDLTAVKEDSK
ncbi:pyridoxal phosphate-dependent aminotransferase [Bifidobacterium sp.]|jgi:aminotransferase|uniref:pyridoxal phosphate-dependent aminotransferase n=1 Tax=Bifidobacterium sp. TaxID=41200 RepID=UPI0025C24F36|nr:aminotransferase class I/II-fold pyridoxal phosphate-dependent enzyme [Bifidobacterium sp.]MCI1636211.1 aminotransferase class I/II-fold pyridoxal phosphate-dependent enzyme [Bifidobacterium sp.]